MSKSHVRRVRELYKIILRLHRSLPDDLKILGDNYAREEFKRHKKCKPQEAQIFLNEWREYVVSMSRQVAPARAQRRQDEQQAGPFREVRADPEQGAAGGGEGRAADQQGSAGARETAAAAADALISQAAAAGARRRRRLGNDLDKHRLLQFTPDQVLTLYNLSMTARGEDPQAENSDEPIEFDKPNTDGIGLIEADNININLNSGWLKLFEEGQEIKNSPELRHAIDGLAIADREFKSAKSALEIAEMEFEAAIKLADMAFATAKNTKTVEKNALKEAKKAEELNVKVEKLAEIAKSKNEQLEAALNFTNEILNDRKEEILRKYLNNPDNS